MEVRGHNREYSADDSLLKSTEHGHAEDAEGGGGVVVVQKATPERAFCRFFALAPFETAGQVRTYHGIYFIMIYFISGAIPAKSPHTINILTGVKRVPAAGWPRAAARTEKREAAIHEVHRSARGKKRKRKVNEKSASEQFAKE